MKTNINRYLESIELIIKFLIVVGLLWGAISFLVQGFCNVFFKYELNYVEPILAAAVDRLSTSYKIYTDFSVSPHALIPYNPIYLILVYPLQILTGYGFVAGRIVSMISAISIALVIYHFTQYLKFSRFLRCITALSVFSIPIFFSMGAQMRPDMLGLLFALLALGFFIKNEVAANNKALYLGILMLLLAFFTKQNFLAPGLSYGVYLLMGKRIKEAIHLFLLFVGPALLGMGVLQVLSNENYLQHALFHKDITFLWRLFIHYWFNFLTQHQFIVIPGIVGILICSTHKRARYIGLYTVVNCLLTISLGKVGADSNHLLELHVSILITIFTAISLIGISTIAAATRYFFWLLIAFQIWSYSHGFNVDLKSIWNAHRAKEVKLDEFKVYLNAAKGEVLSENMGILVAAKRPVIYEFYGFCQLTRSNKFDQDIVLNKIRSGYYPLIIVTTNIAKVSESIRYTAEMIESLRLYYRPLKLLNNQILLVPNRA